MKKSLISVLCLILCLCLWAAPALAFNNYAVDVDALKAVEQQDTFNVKITRKTVTDKANGDFNNPDILAFEVTNGSDAAIAQIVIALVAHDAEGKAQQIQSAGLSAISMNMGTDARRLTEITFTPAGASAGAVFTLSQPCDHGRFTGVRAIVKEYTTESGETIANPLFDEWQEEALGRPTHILD
ncbi:MAG: hypothetical protein IJJ23_03870 [Clostridia bacterium]|nr:hypothetical protein [Clostridia bacterium]